MGLRVFKIAFLSLFALYVLSGISFSADSSIGKGLFDAKGCIECHIIERSAMVKADDGVKALVDAKGPPLWFVGDKFKADFLEAWLTRPAPIRPMEYYSDTEDNKDNHPVLNKDDARDITAYLTGLRSGKVKRGVITPNGTVKGRVIFEKKLGCYGCHQMRKKDGSIVGGLSGPTLVGAGERLKGDWIYAYLNNQEFFQPVFIMPISKGLISDNDMRILSAHIADMP